MRASASASAPPASAQPPAAPTPTRSAAPPPAPSAGPPAAGSADTRTPGAPGASAAVHPGPPLGPEALAALAPPGGWPGRTDGCAEGMVRVEGDYCPAVVQDCIEHHPEYKQDPKKSERCLRFRKSRCALPKRQRLSFCMDRFEYPNELGELPRVLTPWSEAVKLCEARGKRLCTEDEFNFACEGPDMLPYVQGLERDSAVCNLDRFYERPDHRRVLPTYDRCLTTPWCAEELARLDQRHRIGARLTCVSWAGLYDLNGNVNEWVNLPGETRPNRSGLKGGWWGPVRSRCRPTVTFHKEEDYGYEQGFRCCSDAKR